jgi:capsular exopolysaccharide synthesis family protein
VELQDYLAILRKRWLSIAIITLLATAAAVGATVLVTPTYTARAQVYVSVRTGGTTSDLLQGSNFTVRQVKSYTDLVTTPLVLTPVIENLDLPTTPDELAKSITASSPLDTSLINISATHEDPQVASDIANATAESLSTNVTALEKPTDGESPVQISTVRIASAPLEPSAPNAKLNVALGLLVGLALGFGIAVLRQVLDTRIRTVEDIRAVTQASVMTVMTHDDDAVQHPLIVQSNPHSPRAEAFRRLRTNLQFLDVADRLESIVVTSALPSEGKSTVAINLAITLADAGSRVALVDADLRRPSVAEYMGIEGRVGLTTVLIGQAKLEHVIQPWGGGNLHVLPSGQVPPNPSEMVGSHAMGWVLGELVKEFDVVVVDAPPLLPVTDAAILARLAGGALVVAGANRLHRAELSEALEGLDAVGARVLGLVLNHLARKQSDAYAYYGVETRDPKRRRSASEKRRSTRVTAKQAAAGPVRRTVSERQADEGRLDDLLGSEGAPTSPRRWPGDPVV